MMLVLKRRISCSGLNTKQFLFPMTGTTCQTYSKHTSRRLSSPVTGKTLISTSSLKLNLSVEIDTASKRGSNPPSPVRYAGLKRRRKT